MNALPSFFGEYQGRVDQELRRLVPASGETVQRSMAYTVHAPSKRVRPVLTMLSAELCGGSAERALPVAAVVELVHASSLILDDLPSMDDAPLRRGRPTNHREFGEAVAILASFGLLNLAFGTLSRSYEPALASRLTSLLADAVGGEGLIGGQAADLLATKLPVVLAGDYNIVPEARDIHVTTSYRDNALVQPAARQAHPCRDDGYAGPDHRVVARQRNAMDAGGRA